MPLGDRAYVQCMHYKTNLLQIGRQNNTHIFVAAAILGQIIVLLSYNPQLRGENVPLLLLLLFKLLQVQTMDRRADGAVCTDGTIE